MRILRFSAVRFRNFAQTALEPGPGVNVIFGENGQGKTNLIESVWLFTGCRSFRTAENAEMIRHGETAAALEAAFLSNGREQSARLVITRRRELTLNGFPEATSRRMLGVFPAIAFSPATLRMVQGSPGGRRRFLDIALSMLQPSYAVCLSKYIKTLAQRNAVLAKAGLMQAAALRDALSLWDEVLAKEAALLLLARRRYMERFAPGAAEFYSGAAGGREALSVRYVCKGAPQALFEAGDAEALAAQLRKSYAQNLPSDLRLRATGAGPHRDDLLLSLDGVNLRSFGSQGQQRTAALALKLAEAAVLREITEEAPVALLDDVLSELDARRQKDLLRFLEGWQIFLTCCEPSHLLHGAGGKVFCVTRGIIEERAS